jgi:uncharacterized damage-inducible protein DinB
MKETERIRQQLERAFTGGAWHGPGVLELLENVTATQAASRPIAGAHSIWELVLHIKAWEDAVRRRLLGDRAELSDEEDWPPANDTSNAAWAQALTALRQGNEELINALHLAETKLDEPILEGMTSTYANLHGVVQHSLYHAGQIAILKKAATGGTV